MPVKALPILFSAPMVRALLDCRKKQTRRIIKPQPSIRDDGIFQWKGALYRKDQLETDFAICPYGRRGDLLWVKESIKSTFTIPKEIVDGYRYKYIPSVPAIEYMADGFHKLYLGGDDKKNIGTVGKARPSMFMPRWASRLTLEITGVRVEPVQDISNEDAIAEGIEPIKAFDDSTGYINYLHEGEGTKYMCGRDGARLSYESLWRKLNGIDSWQANPWVWVIEFNVRHYNVDKLLKGETS